MEQESEDGFVPATNFSRGPETVVIGDEEEALDTATSVLREQIMQCLRGLSDVILIKNNRYGNSALNPLRVFSDANRPAEDDIYVRLDDKLSRIKNSKEVRFNDVADVMGYCTLLCISKGWADRNLWAVLID